jgi:plasmid stabilization system protein ParE
MVWTRTALRGVARAHDYILDFNPKAAARMAKALMVAGASLVNFPHRGRPARGKTGQQPARDTGMRELASVSPYIIRYRIEGDTVVILRVRHMTQRPAKPSA